MDDGSRLAEALGPQLAEHLRDRLESVRLERGDTLLEAGVPSPWLHVVLEGGVEVRRQGPRGPVILGLLEPGSLVGEVGFIDGGPATATLVATANTRLARLERAALAGLQAEHPLLAGQLLRRISTTMAARLDQTSLAVFAHEDPPAASRGTRTRLRRLLGRLVGAR